MLRRGRERSDAEYLARLQAKCARLADEAARAGMPGDLIERMVAFDDTGQDLDDLLSDPDRWVADGRVLNDARPGAPSAVWCDLVGGRGVALYAENGAIIHLVYNVPLWYTRTYGVHQGLEECGALLYPTTPLEPRDWWYLARWYLAGGREGRAVGIPPPPGRSWMNQQGLIQRADGSYPAQGERGLTDEWEENEEQRARFGHLPFYHQGYRHFVDPDDLNPESDSDGMESPDEGDEQLRGSDHYLPPAPQAAPLSRDGGVAAPVLDVLVPGMVGWEGREADRAAVGALAAERVAVAAAVREEPAAAGSASGGCERGRGRGLARGRVRWRGRVLGRERVRGSGRAFARGGGLGGGSGGGCRAAP